MRILKHDPAERQSDDPSTYAITEIGRIGMGIVDESNPARPHPKATDYFVPRGEFVQEFLEIYGDKPTKIPIKFFSDKTDFSCQERLELRDRTGKLYGFGDGFAFNFYNNKTKNFSHLVTTNTRSNIQAEAVTFLAKGLPPEKAKYIKWRETLYLRFMIADFPVTGYWQLVVHGKHSSIPNLRDTFDLWFSTFKTIRNVPFILSIKKMNSDTSGDSKQYSVASLIPNFPVEPALQLAQLIHASSDENPAPLVYKHLVCGAPISDIASAQPLLSAPLTED